MKGLVLEKRNGISAVMTEDGIVRKVNKIYRVGETIEVDDSLMIKDKSRSRKSRTMSRIIATAASVMLLLLAGGVSYETAFASTYVSVDVNPSIEFALNRIDRVIGVTAINEDAEPIVEQLNSSSVGFNTLDEALEKTASILKENNYLTTDTNVMLVDIASDDDSVKEKLMEHARRGIESIRKNEGMDEVEFYIDTASMHDREEAQSEGMSIGRYKAMKEAEATDEAPAEQELPKETPDKPASQELTTPDETTAAPPTPQELPQGEDTDKQEMTESVSPAEPSSENKDTSEEFRKMPVEELIESLPGAEEVEPAGESQTPKQQTNQPPEGQQPSESQQQPEIMQPEGQQPEDNRQQAGLQPAVDQPENTTPSDQQTEGNQPPTGGQDQPSAADQPGRTEPPAEDQPEGAMQPPSGGSTEHTNDPIGQPGEMSPGNAPFIGPGQRGV